MALTQPKERGFWIFSGPSNYRNLTTTRRSSHYLMWRVLDLEGKLVKTQALIIGWSDGLHLLGQPNFAQSISRTITPKERSGWANQPIWNKFRPEDGQRGAWCCCLIGASDVVAYPGESAFVRYTRAHHLGAPLTVEATISAMCLQGFAGGIVFTANGSEQALQQADW